MYTDQNKGEAKLLKPCQKHNNAERTLLNNNVPFHLRFSLNIPKMRLTIGKQESR